MYFVALKMLMGDTGKYIGILIGITFAALIMTQQPSIFVGIMMRTYSFLTDVNYPDLWVMDPTVRFVDDIRPMQDTKLLRVRGVKGVEWAVPLYKGALSARMPDGNFRTCVMIGLDDATLIGAPGKLIQGKLEDLRQAGSVIIDEDGANKYLRISMPDGSTRPMRPGDTMELNDNRAVVVGIVRTTRSFQSQPVVYTTYSRVLQFSPVQRLQLSFILVGLKKGFDAEEVKATIKRQTTLSAYTPHDFKKLTIMYYLKNTGIPINFGMSVGLGFLVGAAIAGQMFFNFTQDSIMQFGALKAMGTSNSTLMKMILMQGLLVGVTGWGIGVGLASLFGYATRGSVIAFSMGWQILGISAVGVMLIVMIAAFISIRKVIMLEPAIVFKG